jgi:ligand-binding SRPBCC domain-containing protein
MLPPFRFGVGGPVGSGRQYVPWIHLQDLVRVIAAALVDNGYEGPINGVGPEQVTSREFAKALGRALRRPAVLPAPALALTVIFGEAAGVLLGSQRVEPRRLRELGFAYRFPTLDQALADIIQTGDVEIMPARSSGELRTPVKDDYLRKRRPTYELRARTVLDTPIDEAFAFFSQAENLGLLTPAAMRFEIQGGVPAITQGATVDYRLRVGPMPIRWRTRIVAWEPPHGFIDVQESGPYRCWWHKHTFSAAGNQTVMEDHVYYAPPLGALGRHANRWFIVPRLRQIFGYRSDVIRLRFGAS